MKRWLLLVLLLSSACGDALVDGEHRGEPYMRVEGLFRGSPGDGSVRSPHLGILWAGPCEEKHFEAKLTPILASTPLTSTFTFELWDLPPRSAMRPLCDNDANVAVGSFIVYDDVDENGWAEMRLDDEGLRIGAPDRALGIAPIHYLLYTDRPIRGCDPFPDVEAGFHVLVSYNHWLLRPENAHVEIFIFDPTDVFPGAYISCFAEM